ncbi:PAS domain S-box-containing protein [Pseudooceanicola antarcticus]|uniref:histidine kinase n=1 Tax=Pseudooceanicola antarcticus TaxID=1247613 RepID=A0A285IQL5_9RHOB|nr:PAS domain-containing sensor histidine kinase [Pseudooceanicola antarcticus]PJE31438.1 PAS domain-containing sensor histidine kinase [Pseudooceanicola antarcticus]SNY49987.1 PAS domain S-box-containing protein [Pseudooceanicola antarcticus]
MLNEDQVASATWRITPDPMCILDRDGRFASLNPAWQKVLGWTRDQMVGHAFQEFLHPDDLVRSEEAFAEVLQGRPVLRFENRYRTTEGDYRWLSWVAVPENDSFVCTVRDVTEEKIRERLLEEQRKEALLHKQILAILGHDLRNPLASVTAGVRMLSRQEQTTAGAHLLRNMAASSMRMAELIENLMDLTRIQLGQGIVVTRGEVSDLKQSLEHVIHEIEAARDNVTVELNCQLSAPVNIDGPRMMQVVSNLLGNAVTHGSAGTPIQLIVDQTETLLTIAVCNSGHPIPQESWETLFQPFFRKPAIEGRTSPQGLGLGLYICQQIVSAHGGEIKVTSDEEETCFTVEIPGI